MRIVVIDLPLVFLAQNKSIYLWFKIHYRMVGLLGKEGKYDNKKILWKLTYGSIDHQIEK